MLDRRLIYEGSEEINEMAQVAEGVRGSFPAERVPEALDLVRRHLPDPHRARLRVVEGLRIASYRTGVHRRSHQRRRHQRSASQATPDYPGVGWGR